MGRKKNLITLLDLCLSSQHLSHNSTGHGGRCKNGSYKIFISTEMLHDQHPSLFECNPDTRGSIKKVGSSRSMSCLKIFHIGPKVSFSPTLCMSSTYTDKSSCCFFNRHYDTPKSLPCPKYTSKVVIPTFFPKPILPASDQTDVFHREPVGLQSNPHLWVLFLWQSSSSKGL